MSRGALWPLGAGTGGSGPQAATAGAEVMLGQISRGVLRGFLDMPSQPAPGRPKAAENPLGGWRRYPGAGCPHLTQIGNWVVDSTCFNTMKDRICRTPGRCSNCSACSRLKLSLSRVRTSMK